MLPILLQILICICIGTFMVLHNSIVGFILKGFFGLWVLVLLKVSYNKMMLPGICLGTFFFSLAMWLAPHWLMYVFLSLMLAAIFVTYKTAEAFCRTNPN